MMRVLFFFALFLFVLSLIDTVSAQCADGSSPFNCLVRPCNANSCKKGIDFCVDDYCGGCNAKCQCSANSDCFDGQQCQSGFCVAVSTTAAPSSCPSTVETSECVCSHLGKYWAVGGFFDGCNSCQCTEDKRVLCTKKLCPIIPTDQPTEEPSPITTSTSVDTCVITNNDFSTCQNGITPCAVVRCGFGGECIAHRCGTDNNQCKATCSCADDSHCASGQICAANEFGIKVCQDNTSQECENGQPGVRCFAAPCSVLSSNRQCKKGADFCLNDYCGGCNAFCQCDTNSDCYSDQQCKADWKGRKICQAKSSTTTTTPRPSRTTTTRRPSSTTTRRPSRTTTTTHKPSRTTTSTAPATTACAGKVCPAILCANRAPCKYQCGINYCSCTDYCKCKNNSHCESNERCEIASGETEGKCVNKNRPLLSKLDKF